MKSWEQLSTWAARRKLAVHNQGGVVVLHRATRDRATLVSVQAGRAMTGDDGDRVARAAIEAAIREVTL
jgi:hypothetical protein